jgi:ABC-2 type transport system permease protein
MRRLLGSELLRFRSRRLVVVLFGAALGGSAVGAAIAASQSTPPTDAVRAEAHAEAERRFRECLALDFEEAELGGSLEEYCRDYAGEETRYMPSHLALVQLPAILEGVSSLLIIVGLVVGSSLVAASWQTGTIGTILTWEPRRARWFAARLLVVGLGVAALSIAILAFLSLALAAAAALRGSTILADGWWADVGVTGMRVAAAAAAAAVIGGSIGAVGRHTAAALGAVFVWSAVLEGIVRGVRPRWSPWLLGENVVAFLSWGTMEFQASASESYTITPGHAVLVLLGYTAVVVALGFTLVRIRDVQ